MQHANQTQTVKLSALTYEARMSALRQIVPTLTENQVALIYKLGRERVDTLPELSADESKVLGQLIDLNIVEKVAGHLGWTTWQIVDFYDVRDAIEEGAPTPTVPLLPATTLTRPATVIEETPEDDSALLGPIFIPGQNVNDFFAKAAKSIEEPKGHECSNCGTRWQSPDYSSCPRCGYAPTATVETVATVSTETTAAPIYLYAPMNRPAMYATVPAGFTVVSEEQTDFTPYGTISYTAPLDALTAWKYELKNLSEDYKVGDDVAWIEGGNVLTSKIYQIDSKWEIWADEYTKLPFWALHLVETPAPVDPVTDTPAATETTAASQAYAVGDTVSFHYALSNIDGNLYTGVIKSPVKRSELWGDVVLIEPLVNAYHLPPRHVSVERIVAVIATAPVIDAPQPAVQASGACVVPYVTETDTLRAILDLSNEATQAELDGRKSEARAISKEHTRLYDAYMKALKADADKWKPTPQSRQEAVSAPSATMQDTTREMVANPPQIESDASPRLFAPHKPLPTDRATLAAKRQAQHDAAQARIKAGLPAPQIAPQRPVAPVSAAPVIVKPRSAMNAAQQASEDGLQALIASSRKNA